jgi:hypothetical protein
MDKGIEFFDAWAKSQKEFLEASLKSQEEFRAHWLESMKGMQEFFLKTAGPSETPQSKEMLNFFNSWFSTMLKSSEIFSDEAVKIQKTWKTALEHQMEMSRELVKNFSNFFQQPENK